MRTQAIPGFTAKVLFCDFSSSVRHKEDQFRSGYPDILPQYVDAQSDPLNSAAVRDGLHWIPARCWKIGGECACPIGSSSSDCQNPTRAGVPYEIVTCCPGHSSSEPVLCMTRRIALPFATCGCCEFANIK